MLYSYSKKSNIFLGNDIFNCDITGFFCSVKFLNIHIFHTWYVEQITIKGEEFLMVKPLFSATHFRRNLISHGCHIVLKLQHYRVSRRKNSSHYLKVMVINMSNWFVTRIWSMASNKKKILLNSILKQRWTSIFTYAVILWKKRSFCPSTPKGHHVHHCAHCAKIPYFVQQFLFIKK